MEGIEHIYGMYSSPDLQTSDRVCMLQLGISGDETEKNTYYFFFFFFFFLSSAAKPGTHFLENNKIVGVFTMLKLCVSKEPLAY